MAWADYLGCDPNSVVSLPGSIQGGPPERNSCGQRIDPATHAETVLVGSFNLQRLGPTKLGDPWVMEKFADLIRRFDVIALQEITSKDQRTLPLLVEEVNRAGGRYSYTISPRIGRESSGYYEQYAFVFDTARIHGGPNYCYVVQDHDDILHREPFVGRFETIVAEHPFRFTLINIHTDPDEISYELDVLADVVTNVRQFEYPGEDDVILLGDLNAAPDKFQRLGQIPGYVPLIQGLNTNTRKNRLLDNILADNRATSEYTGRSGMIDLEKHFQIQLKDAERISDHLPVWAEFTISENTAQFGATASRDFSVAR